MEKIKQIYLITTSLFYLNSSVPSYGQFVSTSNGNSGETPTNFETIGIGYFSNNANNIRSVLHINSNLTATSTVTNAVNPGEVFRTDAPNLATYWRMLKNATEYGTIFNNDDTHFYIAASATSGIGAPYGNLYLLSGGNTPVTNTRMTIIGASGFVGIGTGFLTPSNTLEIDGDLTGLNNYSSGISGLRFNDLASTSPPITPNPGHGVLSVDGSGDVIYVLGDGAGAPGNYCNSTNGPNPLTDNYEIALDNFANQGHRWNYYFTGQGQNYTNVLIGVPCGTIPPFPAQAKLYVLQDTPHPYNFGTYTASITAAGQFDNTAGGGAATGSYGIGALGTATNNDVNVGIAGIAMVTSGGNNANYGVWGQISAPAGAGEVNYGVRGDVPQTTGATAYAIYGDLGISCTSLPCTTAADYAGYFNGDVFTTCSYLPSDSKLKNNIHPISNAMSILSQLNPKSYTYQQQQFESMHLPGGEHYGLLADSLESVLPNLVKNSIHPARYDSTGKITHPAIDYKAVNITEIIPFLIKGMQEQQQSIDSMRAQLSQLQDIVSNCCATNRGENSNSTVPANAKQAIDVQQSSENSIILNQNDPNPFTEHTNITFNIPDDVKDAKIIFFDNLGRILKTVVISERGAGQLNVFSSNLSSGIYSYSLLTDGNVAATKKMVKQN